MKISRFLPAAVLAMAGMLVAQSAFAWHHHHRSRVSVGLHFGIPIGAYPYYPYYYPPVYYPAPVVVQQQPTVYVEQAAPQAQPAQPAGYWYYCADARAYYPYVKECPAGWQRVAPQPGS